MANDYDAFKKKDLDSLSPMSLQRTPDAMCKYQAAVNELFEKNPEMKKRFFDEIEERTKQMEAAMPPSQNRKRYHQLVGVLLGRELTSCQFDEAGELTEGDFAPLPHITIDNCDAPICGLPGDLLERTDQAIAATLYSLLGSVPPSWNELDEVGRCPWLEVAIAKRNAPKQQRSEAKSPASPDTENQSAGEAAKDEATLKERVFNELTEQQRKLVEYLWQNTCGANFDAIMSISGAFRLNSSPSDQTIKDKVKAIRLRLDKAGLPDILKVSGRRLMLNLPPG